MNSRIFRYQIKQSQGIKPQETRSISSSAYTDVAIAQNQSSSFRARDFPQIVLRLQNSASI